jgi:succinate dehydrogenase hydrophobic anchor subunit
MPFFFMLFLFIFVKNKKHFMYEIIQKLHSGWAYVAFLLLVIAVVNSIIGLISKKEYTATDKKIGLFALGAIHTQAVIGFILYFVSPIGFSGFSMSNSALRLTSMEHPLMNILGIVLMTIGWVKHKKLTSSEAKFKTVAIYYGLGLALIASRIPWGLWFK